MRIALLTATALAALLPLSAHAEPEYVGARASTLGLGLEYVHKVTPHISARAVVNNYNYDDDFESDNIQYNGELELGSFGGQVDFRFTEDSPFFVTAGLYANNNAITATADPAQQTDIGGVPFTPEQIGILTAKADFKDSAPYLGLGWRWAAGHVGFSLEAGAYFQGSPKVSLTSNGTLASDPFYQQALEVERRDLEDELKDFKTYPVVSFGIGYKF
jgi:hypothetical protein